MNENIQKPKEIGMMIVDLSRYTNYLDFEPIMKLLSPFVGGFYFGPATCLTAFYAIIMAGQDLQTKTFLDLNLNLDPDDAERMGEVLRKSRASMVSIQCSSGIESVKRFVVAMKKDSQPFRETWDVPVLETKTEPVAEPEKDLTEKTEENSDDDFLKTMRERLAKNPISEPIIETIVRPLIFAITVPARFTHSTSGPAIGNFADRMISYDYIVENGGVDGVICDPNKLTRYHRSFYDGIKKIVSDIDLKAPQNGTGKKISPNFAVHLGADYLLVDDAILNPPKWSSMEKEAEKIRTEIIVAMERKNLLKASVPVDSRPRAIATADIKPPPPKPQPIAKKQKRKKSPTGEIIKKGILQKFLH